MKKDKLGVKKVKKARKSGRETLTLHVKKCKKRSKIGFHAHFRFHAQKKKTLLAPLSGSRKFIYFRDGSDLMPRNRVFLPEQF